MRANHRVPARRPGIVIARTAQGRIRGIGVERTPARDPPLEIFRQRLVRAVSIGEQRVATLARHLDRIEQRRLGGDFLMALIGVEVHFPVGQGADRLPILADVRDQHHGRMLYAERTTGCDPRRRAECLGKPHLGILIEGLVAEQDHQMLVPGVEDPLPERAADRIAQVHAQNFRAERGTQLPHGKRGSFIQCSNRRFHEALPAPVSSDRAGLRTLSILRNRSGSIRWGRLLALLPAVIARAYRRVTTINPLRPVSSR